MEGPTLWSKFENREEDWTGLSDPKKRKQLQNRINQRARRTRKLHAQLASILPSHGAYADKVAPSKRAAGPSVWRASPTYPLYQGGSLSALEWDILFFARDKLWPKPYNSSHWALSNRSAASRALSDLWSRRMLEVPMLRHSVILATCLDLEYLTGRDYTTIRLRHANAVIKQVLLGININASSTDALPQQLGSQVGSCDELFFAVMSLAKQSQSTSITPLPGTFGLFDPPFPLGLQFLNLWGQHQSDHMHCRAMQQMVRSRGGLADAGIETPGFAEALYQFDILESAKTLSRPWMDIPSSRWRLVSKEVAASRGSIEKDVRDKFVQALPRASLSPYASLLDILSNIRVFCTCVQTMQGQMEPGPGSTAQDPCTLLLRDLSALRDRIEHRLLAYTFVGHSLGEQLCWTTALIFTHCVIYPLPNREPVEILLGRLMASLHILDVDHPDVGRPFLIWVCMIGAMACPAAADRTRTRFFSERLNAYAAAEGGISSWSQLRRLLKGFLWLDRACEDGGLAVWSGLSSPVTELEGQ
ncbi:hypothetical protein A1O7_05645 [Cladophialophora yegresii CBS 114405]|uniref:BZIP domain-containing protein n=1 Tax=Cladophialophora yegresii CBS 114405 TaxID=1182544 RepID=W9VZR8_9EURO|nr:uncharacterized protein A1O7_05645 [Cladophialophora yegresii CBS 114405]EXJ58220.1 hypothetical protein A1O7_05645 [Cladophialophora yegresii CBS 114405]